MPEWSDHEALLLFLHFCIYDIFTNINLIHLSLILIHQGVGIRYCRMCRVHDNQFFSPWWISDLVLLESRECIILCSHILWKVTFSLDHYKDLGWLCTLCRSYELYVLAPWDLYFFIFKFLLYIPCVTFSRLFQ